MTNVTLDEIKRDAAAFVDRIRAGEPLLILEADRPVAEVAPLGKVTGKERPFGLCAGAFTLPADFDEPLPEDVLKTFEGE